MEYMRQKMELMERELLQSRERANASEGLLKQQEALRGEVEAQLKSISEQFRQEKSFQDLEQHKQQSEARVESLEKRLDEMHRTWAGLLKESMQRQEAHREAAMPDLKSFTETLGELNNEVRKLKQSFSEFREDVAPVTELGKEVEGLRTDIPAAAQRREAAEVAFRTELQGMVDRLGEGILRRLAEMDKRIAGEVHEHQDRLAAMSRDRHALQEAMEEANHRARQEHLKERLALENQFNEQVAELKTSLEAFAERQSGAADSIGRLQEISKQVHAILSRPAKAKDQMIQDLEAEKGDLMKALRERTEQLRAYSIERREVERGMGESLMSLTREVESERAKRQQDREHIASLESAMEALRAQIELHEQEDRQEQQRFQQLASERDAMALALTEEAGKVRKQIEDRTASDKRWEERILEFQNAVDDERERRLTSEQSAADLRAKVQTLSDHIAGVLREKERAEKSAAEWVQHRDEVEATLRKKDEVIGMLSTTFQNLLKKPE